MSVYLVTRDLIDNTSLLGAGTLSRAIADANSHPNANGVPDEIDFQIPGSGVHTIFTVGALPTITDPVIINGYSQPLNDGTANLASRNTRGVGDNAVLRIDINGGEGGFGVSGLTIAANNCTIEGLAIHGFTKNGIDIDGGAGNVIQGNFIGTDTTGASIPSATSAIEGISIFHGASNNTIGGASYDARNVISANGQDGIGIFDAGTTGNLVEGNYIGTTASGATALGNGNGIAIANGASGNTIGGVTDPTYNIISGNGNGILIVGSGVANNLVQHNAIGTDGNGTSSVPNSYGIVIARGANNNTIGAYNTSDPDIDRNLISGNAIDGVVIEDSGTTENIVHGNLIGLSINGNAPLPNQDGVRIFNGATGNTIGGIVSVGSSYAYFGNYISGNAQCGVIITDADTTGNMVQTNWIGPDFAGGSTSPNGLQGVLIQHSAASNLIGGTIPFASTAVPGGNVISNNTVSGVRIADFGSNLNVVSGNKIGTDVAGNAALPNGNGVEIQNGAEDNIIGSTVAAEANIISGNALYGVEITDPLTGLNVVEGNRIGTNATGDRALGNALGIYILGGTSDDVIGGTVPGSGNVISGNTSNGIWIDGPGTGGCLIAGNYIGTNAAGTADRDDQGHSFGAVIGIMINAGASYNTVGGTTTGAGNVIAGFTFGIEISGAGSSYNLVEGNKIGTDASGANPLGNGDGIAIANGAANNAVGGVLTGAGNIVAFNQEIGIDIGSGSFDTTTVGNAILGNSIFSNGSSYSYLPVQFSGNGIYITGAFGIHNAPGGHTGPNDLQNYPVLVSAVGQADGSVLLHGLFNSSANRNFRIEVFASPAADPAGFGEGKTFLDAADVITDSSGNGSFTLTLDSLPVGTYISSTATDLTTNDTSEFSQDIQVRDHIPVLASVSPNSATEGPLTLTVTGSNFANDAVVLLNGTPLTTSFVSSTELSATAPAGLVEEGTSSVTVSNPGPFGGTSAPLSLSVSDAPLTLFPFPQGASGYSAGSSFTAVVASFTDAGGIESSDHYRATIDWGDGSSSDGVVKFISGGADAIFGTHVYQAEGTYSVLVFVRDDGGASVQLTESVSIVDAPLIGVSKALTFTESTPASVIAASFHDADPLGSAGDYQASIAWGDGSTSSGSVSADGAAFDVNGSHTYARAGNYSVVVTITDAGGATVTVNSSAVVGIMPLSAQGRSFAVTGKKKFSGTVATFTDPDPRVDPTFYSATISWGDGTPDTVGTIGGQNNPFTVTGTHTYGSFTATDILTITITDKLGRKVVVNSRVVDPPADSSQEHGLFVSQLYSDLLDRPADDAGLALWTSRLDHGLATRAQVVQEFVSSLEYRDLEVQRLYSQMLHRQADAGGLAAWVSFMASGGTLEQVQASIAASPEYWQRRAGGSNTGFLAALYQDTLGRNVDPAGQATFGQALGHETSRADVAAALFGSSEYQQKLVQADFEQFLKRTPGQAALDSFMAALRSGARDESLVVGIASSDEYLQNLNLPAAS